MAQDERESYRTAEAAALRPLAHTPSKTVDRHPGMGYDESCMSNSADPQTPDLQTPDFQTPDFQTPVLLLAMPQVQDPFFHKSVVLLLHHQDEGSLGFIVNRPTGVKLSEILEDLEIPWQGDENALAFFGGPVEPQLGTLLYRDEDAEASESRHLVCPGMALTQHVGDLESLAGKPPASFRLLLGYAGWGEGQLVEELLRNDWLTAPVREDLIFNDDPEEVWRLALESLGIDPAQLQTFVAPAGDGSTAN
jgi:putative transcriptional regulator